MIVAVARSCLSASFGRHPWVCIFGEPLIPLPPSQLRRNFPWVQLLPLPQPHPQHMPRAMPAWDGEGPVIRSFTILRDAAVCGWLRKQPLLCRCTGNTLRSLRIVPSSRSWHQTGTNRKGQASPSELAEARACFFISCATRISPRLSGSQSLLPLYHPQVPPCPRLLSVSVTGLFFQDCSIWLHCNLRGRHRVLD